MRMTDKEVDEFIKISEKQGVKYKSRTEASESAHRLMEVYKLLFDGAVEEHQRQERLKKEPKGFALKSEGRTCSLCRRSVTGEVWYDKWGMKCLDCHAAFKKKILPGYVFRDSDNEKYITASELSWKFGLHAQTIKKLIRTGELKARVVNSKTYADTIVFLKRDNLTLSEIIKPYVKDR